VRRDSVGESIEKAGIVNAHNNNGKVASSLSHLAFSFHVLIEVRKYRRRERLVVVVVVNI